MYKNWKIKKSEINEELAKEQELVAHWCNENQKYRINDDEEYIFVEPIPEPTAEELAEQEKAQLKRYLSDTDYVVFKIAEGVASSEEYADVLEKRKQARARLNELGV